MFTLKMHKMLFSGGRNRIYFSLLAGFKGAGIL
jgi:hypothetical protein